MFANLAILWALFVLQAANRRSIAALSVLLPWFVFWDTGVACWWYRNRMDNFWACSDPTIGLSLQPCWWFILITYGGRSPVITRDITDWNEGEPICQPTNCVILSVNETTYFDSPLKAPSLILQRTTSLPPRDFHNTLEFDGNITQTCISHLRDLQREGYELCVCSFASNVATRQRVDITQLSSTIDV